MKRPATASLANSAREEFQCDAELAHEACAATLAVASMPLSAELADEPCTAASTVDSAHASSTAALNHGEKQKYSYCIGAACIEKFDQCKPRAMVQHYAQKL